MLHENIVKNMLHTVTIMTILSIDEDLQAHLHRLSSNLVVVF